MMNSVLSSLLRINRQRMRALRQALASCGYVGSMHLIVLYARRHPGASQEKVACFYAMDKTSIARDARRLEDMGHIRRTVAPGNRRQYQIFLTEAGQAMAAVIDETHEAFQRRLSAGISGEDWQKLTDLLGRLEENSCRAPEATSPCQPPDKMV